MNSSVDLLPNYPLSSLAQAGVLVCLLTGAVPTAEHAPDTAHRDAHYLLVLLKTGEELRLTLDVEWFTLSGPTLLLISPSQVRQLRGP